MMKRILSALFLSLWATLSIAATTETWAPGKGVGYTGTVLCTTADMASLAAGSAVRCTTNQPVLNQTNQDIFGLFSADLTSVTTPAGALSIYVYIYPLNLDGSTYGDNRFGSATAAQPDASYLGCSIFVMQSTTGTIKGSCAATLPPTSFEVVIYNGSGIAFTSTPGTLKYITYDRQQQ